MRWLQVTNMYSAFTDFCNSCPNIPFQASFQAEVEQRYMYTHVRNTEVRTRSFPHSSSKAAVQPLSVLANNVLGLPIFQSTVTVTW